MRNVIVSPRIIELTTSQLIRLVKGKSTRVIGFTTNH